MRVRLKLNFLGIGLGFLVAFLKGLVGLRALTPAAAGLGGRGWLSGGSLVLIGLGTGFALPNHSIQMTSQSVNRKTVDTKKTRTVPGNQSINRFSDRFVHLLRHRPQAEDALRRDIRTNRIPGFETGRLKCELLVTLIERAKK